MARKKLLYVYPFCNFGGVASVIKQRLPFLIAGGFEVHGVFSRDYGGAADLLGAGMESVDIRVDLEDRVLEMAGDFDVVAVIDMPDLVCDIAAGDAADRLIYEIHSGMLNVLIRNSNEALGGCRAVVVPSSWLKQTLIELFPILDDSQIVVCPNLVDETRFRRDLVHDARDGHDGELIWVGKVDEHKNWEEALKIMKLCFMESPHRRGYFVTGGRLSSDAMNSVLELMLELGIAKNVFWLHNMPYSQMPELYGSVARSSGVLIQCSTSESFGMVVHEAARCGVPSVSRRSGAVAEFVRSGETGYVYEDGDCEQAAEMVGRLTADSDFRGRVLEGIKRELKRYDADLLGRQYCDLLKSKVTA